MLISLWTVYSSLLPRSFWQSYFNIMSRLLFILKKCSRVRSCVLQLLAGSPIFEYAFTSSELVVSRVMYNGKLVQDLNRIKICIDLFKYLENKAPRQEKWKKGSKFKWSNSVLMTDWYLGFEHNQLLRTISIWRYSFNFRIIIKSLNDASFLTSRGKEWSMGSSFVGSN